jgi:hypothetical protein
MHVHYKKINSDKQKEGKKALTQYCTQIDVL